MTRYFRVSAGKNAIFVEYAREHHCIGTDWMTEVDLTGRFHHNWREFNREFIPVVKDTDAISSPIAAGLACGMTWTVAMGIAVDDIVLVPSGRGTYLVAKVTGPYRFAPGQPLAHRRPVEWLAQEVDRSSMSEGLRRSTGSIGTVVTLDQHAEEIAGLLRTGGLGAVNAAPLVDDAMAFVLERHLEDFLVSNWPNTELGQRYDIVLDENGEPVGRQYPTDTGPIDILAQSKDGAELLVVELKRGRVSDVVVGQILRYMSYIAETAPDKSVSGVIVGLSDDPRFRRAVSMVPSVRFMRYEVKFRLIDA